MSVQEVVLKKRVDFPSSLKLKTFSLLEDLVIKARKIYGHEFYFPKVSFEQKGTVAGKAYIGKNLITLNATLFIENEKDFFENTIPHELAHLLTRAMWPKSAAHGKEWKSVMRALGFVPSRCHDYDVSSVRKGVAYVCNCPKPHILSTRKHNSIQRGGGALCNICRVPIRLQGSRPSSSTSFVPNFRTGPTTAPRPSPAPRPVTVTRPIPPARPTPVARPTPTPTPVARPAPVVRPSASSHKAPTEAMLKYAKDLGRAHKIMLYPQVLNDFESCRQFISQWAGVQRPK